MIIEIVHVYNTPIAQWVDEVIPAVGDEIKIGNKVWKVWGREWAIRENNSRGPFNKIERIKVWVQ